MSFPLFCGQRYFNPRSPRGERLAVISATATRGLISIHAPREGSDKRCQKRCKQTSNFNPRSPRGERLEMTRHSWTYQNFNPRSPRGERRYESAFRNGNIAISIHAPREGSDVQSNRTENSTDDFNPRSPRGERLENFAVGSIVGVISIHAPREGSDV